MNLTIATWGALAFGAVIGWFVYYVNRYRKGDVQLSDVTTLIGAIGGAAVLALFGEPARPLYLKAADAKPSQKALPRSSAP